MGDKLNVNRRIVQCIFINHEDQKYVTMYPNIFLLVILVVDFRYSSVCPVRRWLVQRCALYFFLFIFLFGAGERGLPAPSPTLSCKSRGNTAYAIKVKIWINKWWTFCYNTQQSVDIIGVTAGIIYVWWSFYFSVDSCCL